MNFERRTAAFAATNAVSFLVHLAAAFVLAPIILHHVGNTDYGLWVLVMSVVGYLALFDLGIRSAVVRFTAAHSANGEADALARVTGAALAAYSLLAIGVVIVTVVVAFFVPLIAHASPESIALLRVLVFVLGADAAMSMPFGVFAGVLEGMQHYLFLNALQVSATIVRSVGFVIALWIGKGLLAIAIIAVLVRLIAHIIIVIRALAVMQKRPSLRGADAATLWKIARHSSGAFGLAMSDRIRFQADAFVIGAFGAPAAIAEFALAARLSDLPGHFIQIMSQVVTPESSRLAATGARDGLRELLLRGNRACALLMLPASVMLLMLAPQALTWWVGAAYASAAPVLVILLVSKMLYFSQAASQRLLVGTGDHGKLVRWLGLEAVLNVILSIALVPRYGIFGVAIGTAVPMALTALVFLPRLLSRAFAIPLSTYFHRVFLTPVLASMGVAASVFLGRYMLATGRVSAVAFQFATAAVICALATALFFLVRTETARSWAANLIEGRR